MRHQLSREQEELVRLLYPLAGPVSPAPAADALQGEAAPCGEPKDLSTQDETADSADSADSADLWTLDEDWQARLPSQLPRFRDHALAALGIEPTEGLDPERHVLIVQRPPGPGGRRLLGLEGLVTRLERLGATVECLVQGPQSYREQWRRWAKVRFVVAAHGAALANLAVAPDHAAAVEVMPRELAPYMAGRWFQNLHIPVDPVYIAAKPRAEGEGPAEAAAGKPNFAHSSARRALIRDDLPLDAAAIDGVVRAWLRTQHGAEGGSPPRGP